MIKCMVKYFNEQLQVESTRKKKIEVLERHQD